MQDLHARQATIARLLAHGVTAEEIAQLAADEAAEQTLRLARAHERRTPAANRIAPKPVAPKPTLPKPALLKPRASAPRASTPAASTPTLPPPPAPPVPPPQIRYRIRNWKDYSAGLVQRGSLTIWFDDATCDHWLANERAGQVGSPTTYADTAIVCALTLRAVFHLPLRQTEGFVSSLMQLVGLSLPVPDYSTLSRRAATLAVALPQRPRSEGIDVVVDSTGVKVYGEGEWKVRQHGLSKRRTWRKVHLGVDCATGEVVAQVTTPAHTADKSVLPQLLDHVEADISQVSADGAYDYRSCYEAIASYDAIATIPPRETAAVHAGQEWEMRNAHIRRIGEIGRAAWKAECGYHRRSLAETTMFRFKTLFGPALSSRDEQRQHTEVAIRCAALNRMTLLGMPHCERVVVA